MNRCPLVSILMPIYDGDRYLEAAVASVVAQTYPHWELLMVDDGSRDQSVAIATRLAASDDRIRLFFHENKGNRGVSATRNRGLREARGRYVALLDCDDLWLPERLDRQITVMSRYPEVVLVYSRAEVIDAEGCIQGPAAGTGVPGLSYHMFESLLHGRAWVPCPTALAPTALVRGCGGFDATLTYQIEDHLLFTRIAERGPVYFIFSTLARYRKHERTWTARLDHKTRSRAYLQYCDRLIRSVAEDRRNLVSDEFVAKWVKLAAQGGRRYVLRHPLEILRRLLAILTHPLIRPEDKGRALLTPAALVWRRVRGFLAVHWTHIRHERRLSRRTVLHKDPLDRCDFTESLRAYIAGLADRNGPYGAYRFASTSRVATLYASVYALLTRHLMGDLEKVDSDDRRCWAEYILDFQCPDGLFRDPAVAGTQAEWNDDWGWRHLGVHVIAALAALGRRTRYPFSCVEFLYGKHAARRWLETLNWREDAAHTGNRVMNHGVLLQYNRDAWNQGQAGEALTEIYCFLAEILDPRSGLWGGPFPPEKNALSLQEQTAYHLWLLFAYDRRPFPAVERAVDACLSLQNSWGGFGPGRLPRFRSNPFTSACEDIDCIDPLCRMIRQTSHRRNEIRQALRAALDWVYHNRNPDGGFVFRRGEALCYGHPHLSSALDESNLFATWFRTLSLGYMAEVLGPDTVCPGVTFRFVDAPGYQFWRSKPEKA